ncbi:MAG: LPP20 family lipoprotein [Sulfurimonas sp.]|nr:LPP20 family lipoprotein [Sulfurimonas sp.]
MKYFLLLVVMLSTTSLMAETVISSKKANPLEEKVSSIETDISSIETDISKLQTVVSSNKKILSKASDVRISVVGQGVAPMNTFSPAQAYALSKRAATADAYRLIAEKVKGVYIEGQDLVKNMMVKRSTVRTSVQAMVRNANVVETTFKDGLCEVEMEIVLSHAQFAQ